jgi:predicted TIM-barrel fold metal-dependent hydrolase
VGAYRGPIVDIDVHHRPKDWSEVQAYLPMEWQDYLPINPPDIGIGAMNDHDSRIADSFPDDGTYPGSDYEVTKKQLLDPNRYYKYVLTHDVGAFPAHSNQYFMSEVCRAVNDLNVDTWLSIDDHRLYSVIVVPTALPEEAPREIRRLADHPKLVAVLLAANPFGRPLGDPIYHPIYEAAAEHRLPITIHPGIDRPNTSVQLVGGPVTTVISFGSQITQQAHHYISSMIVHGVFEKYPDTRVLVEEYGIAWLPWLMWRLDEQYGRLREESPWVKKWPSEYIRKHIKLSTQPIEDVAKTSDLAELLQMVDGIEDLLCFSSDYPHHTMDDPSYAARVFPKSWHHKIFLENACRTYNWDLPVASESGATRAA